MNISFTVLGSSAGMPQAGRCNSGYVLEVGDRLLQFDCGGGISSAFRRAGFDPLAVERVVVSHTHPDHVSDLPLFIQMIYLAGRAGGPPVTIHLPGEAIEAFETYFRAVYVLKEKLPFEVRFVPVPEDGVIEADGVIIQPIRNGHLKKYAPIIDEYDLPNKMQCYSYLVRVGKKSLLYSADLGSEKDLFAYLDGLDVLVIECTHIDLTRLLEKGIEAGVRQVVLTHIAEDFDITAAIQEAQKLAYDGLVIAHDGLRVEL